MVSTYAEVVFKSTLLSTRGPSQQVEGIGFPDSSRGVSVSGFVFDRETTVTSAKGQVWGFIYSASYGKFLVYPSNFGGTVSLI